MSAGSQERSTQTVALPFSLREVAALCRWWEEGVILTFNEIPEIWGFQLTSALERDTWQAIFLLLVGWLGQRDFLSSSPVKVALEMVPLHSPQQGESRQASPFKVQETPDSYSCHSQPALSNQVAVQLCPMNPSSAIKKSKYFLRTAWQEKMINSLLFVIQGTVKDV